MPILRYLNFRAKNQKMQFAAFFASIRIFEFSRQKSKGAIFAFLFFKHLNFDEKFNREKKQNLQISKITFLNVRHENSNI